MNRRRSRERPIVDVEIAVWWDRRDNPDGWPKCWSGGIRGRVGRNCKQAVVRNSGIPTGMTRERHKE